MGHNLTNIGEEYAVKTNLDGVSLDIGLYNDSTDAVGDGDDLPLSSEPDTAGNYARQSDTFSASSIQNSNWGIDNDAAHDFDFSDVTTSQDVDSWFLVATFESTEAGDSGAADHLIATGSLSQARDIGSIDTLTLNAGGAGFTID